MATAKKAARLRQIIDQMDARNRDNCSHMTLDDLLELNDWWARSGTKCAHSAIFRLFDRVGEEFASGLIVVGVNRLLAQVELSRLEAEEGNTDGT